MLHCPGPQRARRAIYYENELGRRAAANLLTRDEACLPRTSLHGLPKSFRLRQLGDSFCKLCGGTRYAGSSLWIPDRINSNHCGNPADLSENRCPGISKICEALVIEYSVVWTFIHGAIPNNGRQIKPISSVPDLHSRGRIDNAEFVARCGPYRYRFR
jgi:hypothetical protein